MDVITSSIFLDLFVTPVCSFMYSLETQTKSGCLCPELVHILYASALSSSNSTRAGPASCSFSVYTNLTHCPDSAVVTPDPLSDCGGTPCRATGCAIGALMPIWVTSRDIPSGVVHGRLDELHTDFRDHKRAALLQVWMKDKLRFLP